MRTSLRLSLTALVAGLLAVAGMLGGLPSAASAHLASLRCGQKLVTEGATTTRVRALCGEPVAIRTEAVRRLFPTVVLVPCSPDSSQRCRRQGLEMRETMLEHWTYDFGPRAFMKVATFEGGQLTAVRSAGYGTRR